MHRSRYPRVFPTVYATARGFFPLRFSRQPDKTSEHRCQPIAVCDCIVVMDEHDGVTTATGRGRGIFPVVRPRQLEKHRVATAVGNDRQLANARRRMTGCPNELRVFIVRHRKPADEEFADVDAMDRTFVLARVSRAHQKFASGNTCQVRCESTHLVNGRESAAARLVSIVEYSSRHYATRAVCDGTDAVHL